MTSRAICPACGEWVKIPEHPKIGQKLTCIHCEADLEVIEVGPVELDWAYFEEEDEEEWDEDELDDEDEEWDDDDDDDDDD
jgi:hypothetical protein